MVVGVAEGLALVEKGAAYRTERADSGDRTRPVDTVLFEGAAAELLADSLAARDRLSDAAAVLLAADAFGGAEPCVNMSVARKSVASGKSVSVRVVLGGRRFIKKINKRIN